MLSARGRRTHLRRTWRAPRRARLERQTGRWGPSLDAAGPRHPPPRPRSEGDEMSQQPPTDSAGTPDEPARDAESTQRFDQSPYDVPEPGADDTVAMGQPTYGQAPDPTRTIYSETTSTDPEEDPEQEAAGRPRWVVPVVIAVILLLVIGGVVAAYLLGADDPETPPVAPTVESTEGRSEEHTSELQSRGHLVCRLLLE